MQCRSLVVEILSGDADHVKGSNADRGTSWDFWAQKAYFSSGQHYPLDATINLPDGDTTPYQPGLYVLSAGMVARAKGSLALSWRAHRLLPLAEAIKDLQELQRLRVAAAPVRAAG